MKIISRLFKHWFTTKSAIKRAFPPESLKAIESAVTEGERRHRAEVRLIIEHCLPTVSVLARLRPRQRAIELFGRYRIWDTEENCGVLVYINMADRAVEIVPDRAVMRLITREEWRGTCETITVGFARGEFCDSLIAAMKQLNALLEKHYPASGTHLNQLPNQAIVL
ncbi:MAG: TPM domain-containing protein [Oxalobacter sp.]|nr:MAG: TPM domain-containing protein [Oxalobacter sp.]